MTIKAINVTLDPQDILDEMEAQAELVLERGFALQFEAGNLVLCYNNKALMFARVELAFGEHGKEILDVQVSTVLNADLDVDTVSSNVATLQAVGQVVRKAFEQKQYQIISQ